MKKIFSISTTKTIDVAYIQAEILSNKDEAVLMDVAVNFADIFLSIFNF